MLDPSTLLDHNATEPTSFEKQTAVFGLFYVNSYESKRSQLRRLQQICTWLTSELEPFVRHYPWHCQPVQFKLFEDWHGLAFIYGELACGDDDLWLVTSLLFKVSARDKNLFIRIFDQDGEVLLDDAHSEQCNNRVWINDSAVKLIPESVVAAGSSLTVRDCLHILDGCRYKLSPCVIRTQHFVDEVFARYPEEVLEGILVETVTVSPKVLAVIAGGDACLCNAALNRQLESIFPDFEGDGELETACREGGEEMVDVKIRVTTPAHLFLKEKEGSVAKGLCLAHALDMFMAEEKVDVQPVQISAAEFNAAVEKDPLQTELLAAHRIDKFVQSKEPTEEAKDLEEDFFSASSSTVVAMPARMEKSISAEAVRGKEILQGLQQFSLNPSEDEYRDYYSDSSEDERIARQFAEDGLDIDEDDFFEYYGDEEVAAPLAAVPAYNKPKDVIAELAKLEGPEIEALSSLLSALRTHVTSPVSPLPAFLSGVGVNRGNLSK